MLLFAIVARQPRFPVNEDSQRSVFKSGARCCHDEFRNGTRTTFFVQFANVIVTAIHSLVNKGTKLSWYGKEKISFITREDWDVFKSKLIFHLLSLQLKESCWYLLGSEHSNAPMMAASFFLGPKRLCSSFRFCSYWAKTTRWVRPCVKPCLPWFFTTRSYHAATLDLSIWCLSHRQPWISSLNTRLQLQRWLACFNQPCQFVDLLSLAAQCCRCLRNRHDTSPFNLEMPPKTDHLKTVTSKRFRFLLWKLQLWNPPDFHVGHEPCHRCPWEKLQHSPPFFETSSTSYRDLTFFCEIMEVAHIKFPILWLPVHAGSLTRIAVRIWEEFPGWFFQTMLCWDDCFEQLYYCVIFSPHHEIKRQWEPNLKNMVIGVVS